MSKQKIQAGATLDVATPDEVAKLLEHGFKSWQSEALIGARFPRFSANARVANSAFAIDGSRSDGERLGPDAGFVWDVRRLRITGMAGADVASVYINDVSPTGLIASTSDNATQTGTGALYLWDRQLILQPGDFLVVAGSGLLATPTGSTVTINGQVQEIPISQLWALIG